MLIKNHRRRILIMWMNYQIMSYTVKILYNPPLEYLILGFNERKNDKQIEAQELVPTFTLILIIYKASNI